MESMLDCAVSFKRGKEYIANIFDNKSGRVIGILYDPRLYYAQYMARLISSMDDILEEIYAYRMVEYAKTFNEYIKKGKDKELAERMAKLKVANFDNTLNFIVTGKRD